MNINAKRGQLGPCDVPVILYDHMDNVSVNATEGVAKRCVRIDENGKAYFRLERDKYLTSELLRAMADALDEHSVAGQD